MDMDKPHPQRKHPRLKDYDYSLPGYYYITIHTATPAIRLSTVEKDPGSDRTLVRLTKVGSIIREQLLELENRYPYVKIDKYVIMPTHIHAIIRLTGGPEKPDLRPDLSAVIGAFKSLATRAVNEHMGIRGYRVFQVSFYDTVLRNEKAYRECWRYIDGNPSRWLTAQEK